MSLPKVAHVTTIDMSLRYLLLNQLRNIQSAGYEVIGISSPGPDVAALEAAGIRHIAVSMTRNFTPFADLVSLLCLYRVFRREHFTIVHTHNPKPGLLGQLAARMAGVPIVVNTVHGFYFHDNMSLLWRRFYILMEKIAARYSDAILSQNSEDIQVALREKICAENKIKHLGNGIDLTVFNPEAVHSDTQKHREKLGLSVNTKVVGFVGRLAARRKGFLDYLRAGRHVQSRVQDVRFLIVGEVDHGKEDEVSPSVADDLGIASKCLFLGHRPNAELPGLYSLMSVVVLPSLIEGVPRVLMEASAMGIPNVATDVKGNREVVKHGQNGLLVPFGDDQELADAIVEVITDQDYAQRMGKEGRRIAIERFDERQIFDTIKTEYVRLLTERGLCAPAQVLVN
ncbi:Putative glycosyltransferase EpsD [Anaerolineae bacterium]|nr:Putative glycosyltransferase EpsD [Anaerolineae bacterium]